MIVRYKTEAWFYSVFPLGLVFERHIESVMRSVLLPMRWPSFGDER